MEPDPLFLVRSKTSMLIGENGEQYKRTLRTQFSFFWFLPTISRLTLGPMNVC